MMKYLANLTQISRYQCPAYPVGDGIVDGEIVYSFLLLRIKACFACIGVAWRKHEASTCLSSGTKMSRNNNGRIDRLRQKQSIR